MGIRPIDASSDSGDCQVAHACGQTVGLVRAAIALVFSLVTFLPAGVRAADEVEKQFREQIQPILEDYCFACHGNGMKKGGVALDELTLDPARLRDRELWWAVLKNVRAGIMPPAGKPRPSEPERRLLEDWIKYGAFGIETDELRPRPGHRAPAQPG